MYSNIFGMKNFGFKTQNVYHFSVGYVSTYYTHMYICLYLRASTRNVSLDFLTYSASETTTKP